MAITSLPQTIRLPGFIFLLAAIAENKKKNSTESMSPYDSFLPFFMLSLKGKFSTDSYNVRNMLGMYSYVHICTCSIKISVDSAIAKILYCF